MDKPPKQPIQGLVGKSELDPKIFSSMSAINRSFYDSRDGDPGEMANPTSTMGLKGQFTNPRIAGTTGEQIETYSDSRDFVGTGTPPSARDVDRAKQSFWKQMPPAQRRESIRFPQKNTDDE